MGKVIGSWVVSNNAVLKVLDIEYGIEDELTVQLNEDKPFKAIVRYDDNGDAYIYVLGAHYYLNECLLHN